MCGPPAEPTTREAPRWRATWPATLPTDGAGCRGTDLTVDAIAAEVGFQSGFGLSVAFKRVHGTRPSDYRTAASVAARRIGLYSRAIIAAASASRSRYWSSPSETSTRRMRPPVNGLGGAYSTLTGAPESRPIVRPSPHRA